MSGLGAMVDRASSFAPDPYGRALREAAGAGPTYVFAKLADGMVVDRANLAEYLPSGWARAQLELGHRVGIWHYLQPDISPQSQAALGVLLCRTIEDELGLAKGAIFYAVNDEIQGQPEVARAFVTAYRLRAPLRQSIVVPLGLGFQGGDGQWYPADCNLRAYRLGRFRDVVETFDGQMRLQQVAGVLLAHRRYFSAPKPLLPAPLLDELEPLAWPELLFHVGHGACVFPGERLAPARWKELGRHLRAHGLL